MARLSSLIDPRSEAFRENAGSMQLLLDELRARHAKVAEGGGSRAVEKHVGRGKLLPRERVRRLLDEGSPFLELSALAASGMYNDEVPAAGLITGIGRVAGRE